MSQLNVRFTQKGKTTVPLIDGFSGTLTVENAEEVSPKVGETWAATLVFEEGKGSRANRIVKLLRRIDLAPDSTDLDLGDFWIDPRKLRNIRIFIQFGRAVILRGPSGTGKTTLPARLAKALKLMHVKINIGAQAESKDFFGMEGVKEGATQFALSDLALFLQQAEADKKNGHVTHLLQLDELNRVHPKILSSALHGLFDDTREVTLVTTQGPKAIRLPTNVATIATMNPNDPRFGGTFALDAAMLNRTVVIDFDFPPKEIEVRLLQSRLNASGLKLANSDAIRIVEAASHLREGARTGSLTLCPSPRNTLDAGLLAANGVPVSEAIEDVLLAPYEGSAMEQGTERATAAALVRAKDARLGEAASQRRSA